MYVRTALLVEDIMDDDPDAAQLVGVASEEIEEGIGVITIDDSGATRTTLAQVYLVLDDGLLWLHLWAGSELYTICLDDPDRQLDIQTKEETRMTKYFTAERKALVLRYLADYIGSTMLDDVLADAMYESGTLQLEAMEVSATEAALVALISAARLFDIMRQIEGAVNTAGESLQKALAQTPWGKLDSGLLRELQGLIELDETIDFALRVSADDVDGARLLPTEDWRAIYD